MRVGLFLILCLINNHANAQGLLSENLKSPAQDTSVFSKPANSPHYFKLQQDITAVFRERNFAAAVALTKQALGLAPKDPYDCYNHACALAQVHESEQALTYLEKAVDYGLRNPSIISKDKHLLPLHEHKRFLKILLQASAVLTEEDNRFRKTSVPFPVRDGVAKVTEFNTSWNYRENIFRTDFLFSETPPNLPIAEGEDPTAELLRKWARQGKAAGNYGDLYDNQDGGHSFLNLKRFPQLTPIYYSEEAIKRNLTTGLQLRFLHDSVTIGNSSTALVNSKLWRSQPRMAYSTKGGAMRFYQHYRSNHLYCYPEHNDHDPGQNGINGGYGDVYPVNTPYVLISQGSSGSDQPFLEAFAATLAAFRPATKKSLTDSGGLMPAVQMILRRSNTGIETREDYLSGKAHPTVFSSTTLDPLAMIKMAQSIKPDRLPPRIAIHVVEDDQSAYGGNQRLFDTPQAIARMFYTHRSAMRLVVSSNKSSDPQNKDLTYHWKILRGNPETIKIRPLNETGSTVELTIPYHERSPIQTGAQLESNRVDIGAFVENEYHLSDPAFICINFLDNEKRVYNKDGKLTMIDFTDEEKQNNYTDTAIAPRRNWRDELQYRANGELAGWTRYLNNETQTFNELGQRLYPSE